MKAEGRTFLISGGASGLGKACAEALVRRGANVAILDYNSDNGESAAAELGASTKFFRCDVSQTASIAEAVKAASQWARDAKKPLGGVIPAAGISLPGTMLDRNNSALSLDSVDLVLNINLRGTIDLVRQAVEQIAKVEADADGERGVVVMVSSSAAFDGQKGQVSYAASKGAVASLTLPMARDLARHGIRCVTVAPSLFDTGMTSLMSDKVRSSLEATFEFPKRAGRPSEFAQLALEIIQNSMLNGTVIRIDGGSRPSKL
ncbi:hypothetical protein CDD83_6939 [Cordyceps sp. RAO-2017]|nr:hypothetical protein CDD83_6939 [Cordyceps sp. RAO-2017]